MEIINLAAVKGRVVQIEVVNGYVTGSHTPIPVVFHINQASRLEAKRIYRALRPDPSLPAVEAGAPSPVPIYYHAKTDTIYFHGRPSPFGEFFSRTRLPLFKNPSSLLELSNITTIQFKNVVMTEELLFWILLFPRRDTEQPALFRNVSAFSSLKKVEILMARPTAARARRTFAARAPIHAAVQAPPSAATAGTAVVTQTNPTVGRFARLFIKLCPKVYDATDKPCIVTMDYLGRIIGEFWDQSYDVTEKEEKKGRGKETGEQHGGNSNDDQNGNGNGGQAGNGNDDQDGTSNGGQAGNGAQQNV